MIKFHRIYCYKRRNSKKKIEFFSLIFWRWETRGESWEISSRSADFFLLFFSMPNPFPPLSSAASKMGKDSSDIHNEKSHGGSKNFSQIMQIKVLDELFPINYLGRWMKSNHSCHEYLFGIDWSNQPKSLIPFTHSVFGSRVKRVLSF